MSRSRRKTPKHGVTTARSEKEEKAKARRKERRLVREILAKDPDKVLPHPRELSDPWNMGKDGKLYWGRKASRRIMRK